jgi:hypothetical protein
METSQSKLETRPRIWLGTRVFMSVDHTTLPSAASAPLSSEIIAKTHARSATANATRRSDSSAQAPNMTVTHRRGRPVWATSSAAATAPGPVAARMSPNVAPPWWRSFLTR